MFWIITKWMKITEKQICEDQIVTFKQSHILLYQGLLFLTRSTCVIVDARSHMQIPRFHTQVWYNKLSQITYHEIDPTALTRRKVKGNAWESSDKNVFENNIIAITTGSHWSQCINMETFPLLSNKMSPNIVIGMWGTANFLNTVWVVPSLPQRMSTSSAVGRVINSTRSETDSPENTTF